MPLLGTTTSGAFRACSTLWLWHVHSMLPANIRYHLGPCETQSCMRLLAPGWQEGLRAFHTGKL